MRAELATDIENGIRDLFPLGLRSDSTSADRVRIIRTEFEEQLRKRSFHGLVRRHGALAIAVIPGNERQFDWEELKKRQIPPPRSNGSNPEFTGKSVVSVCPGDPGPFSIAELRTDGVIFAANTSLLDPVYNGDSEHIIPAPAIEDAIITSVAEYLRTLQAMNAPLPWHICVSLLEIHGYRLLVSKGNTSRRPYPNADIIADSRVVPSLANVDSDEKVATFLRPVINYIWREFGFEGSTSYTKNGIYSNRLW
ncbi:MAG: hypothetical protein ACLQNE_10560 [Thermoguttaceae bacterium]